MGTTQLAVAQRVEQLLLADIERMADDVLDAEVLEAMAALGMDSGPSIPAAASVLEGDLSALVQQVVKLRCLQLQHKLQTQQAVLAAPGLGPAWEQLTSDIQADQDTDDALAGNGAGTVPEESSARNDAETDPYDVPPTAQDVLNKISNQMAIDTSQRATPSGPENQAASADVMMPSIQRPGGDQHMPPANMQYPPMGPLGGMPDMAALHAAMQQQLMHGAWPAFIPGMDPLLPGQLPPDQALHMMLMMMSGHPQGMQQHMNMNMPPLMHDDDGSRGPMPWLPQYHPQGQSRHSDGHLAHMNAPMRSMTEMPAFMQASSMAGGPSMGPPQASGPNNINNMQMMPHMANVTQPNMQQQQQQQQRQLPAQLQPQQQTVLAPLQPALMMPFGWDGNLPVPPAVLPPLETLMAAVHQGVVLPEMMWLAGLEQATNPTSMDMMLELMASQGLQGSGMQAVGSSQLPVPAAVPSQRHDLPPIYRPPTGPTSPTARQSALRNVCATAATHHQQQQPQDVQMVDGVEVSLERQQQEQAWLRAKVQQPTSAKLLQNTAAEQPGTVSTTSSLQAPERNADATNSHKRVREATTSGAADVAADTLKTRAAPGESAAPATSNHPAGAHAGGSRSPLNLGKQADGSQQGKTGQVSNHATGHAGSKGSQHDTAAGHASLSSGIDATSSAKKKKLSSEHGTVTPQHVHSVAKESNALPSTAMMHQRNNGPSGHGEGTGKASGEKHTGTDAAAVTAAAEAAVAAALGGMSVSEEDKHQQSTAAAALATAATEFQPSETGAVTACGTGTTQPSKTAAPAAATGAPDSNSRVQPVKAAAQLQQARPAGRAGKARALTLSEFISAPLFVGNGKLSELADQAQPAASQVTISRQGDANQQANQQQQGEDSTSTGLKPRLSITAPAFHPRQASPPASEPAAAAGQQACTAAQPQPQTGQPTSQQQQPDAKGVVGTAAAAAGSKPQRQRILPPPAPSGPTTLGQHLDAHTLNLLNSKLQGSDSGARRPQSMAGSVAPSEASIATVSRLHLQPQCPQAVPIRENALMSQAPIMIVAQSAPCWCVVTAMDMRQGVVISHVSSAQLINMFNEGRLQVQTLLLGADSPLPPRPPPELFRPLALLSCMALCGVPYVPACVLNGSQVEAPHAGWCVPPCLLSAMALPPATHSPTAVSPVHQRMEQVIDSCPFWMILDRYDEVGTWRTAGQGSCTSFMAKEMLHPGRYEDCGFNPVLPCAQEVASRTWSPTALFLPLAALVAVAVEQNRKIAGLHRGELDSVNRDNRLVLFSQRR